jgi:hypothetical protein
VPERVPREPFADPTTVVWTFNRHEHPTDRSRFPFDDQDRLRCMEEDTVGDTAEDEFRHSAMSMGADDNEISIDRGGGIEQKPGRLAKFAELAGWRNIGGQ